MAEARMRAQLVDLPTASAEGKEVHVSLGASSQSATP